MSRPIFDITSKVIKYPGMAGWYFVKVDNKQSKIIKHYFGEPRRGWGSIPVGVTLGKSKWRTSIFPDKRGFYVLPIKKTVRKENDIKAKDTVKFSIKIREV